MPHTTRNGKNTTNLSVTAKCLAIVFSDSETRENDAGNRTNVHSGKQLLDDFKLRNKTCYWNPALTESIKSLRYKGFLEPLTILVVGDEVHLENLRAAWGRRVLKGPFGFNIKTIGDVSSIEMQEVPQTQFIPLPDALCLTILELNSRCIVATLDTIKEQLLDCYKEMTMPNDHHIFDTLGNLIQQRKIFHSGNGYFVVTPETYTCQAVKQSLSLTSSWLPYHPFYMPVLPLTQELPSHLQHQHCTPSTAFTCSISCQAGVLQELQPFDHLSKTDNKEEIKSKQQSLSRRESKARKGAKEQKRITRDEESMLKRSTSLNLKHKPNDIKDINLKKRNINKEREKGDKKTMSFFAKIFSRSKNRTNCTGTGPTPEPKLKPAEYASFSAQFPPPEWLWYKQQVEKHRRTQEWVCNQEETSSTRQCLPKFVPITEDDLTINLAPCKVDKKIQTCQKHSMNNHNNEHDKRPQEKQKGKTLCHLKSEKYSKPVLCSTFPSPVLPLSENVNQLAIEKKDSGRRDSTPLMHVSSHPFHETNQVGYQNSQSVSIQHKQKLHNKQKHRTIDCFNQNDISFEYVGMLPNKNSQYLKSRDNGVNCVGLPMTAQNNTPNAFKFNKHDQSQVNVRNKLERIELEFPTSVPQCHFSKMSEDHIEKDSAVIVSTKFHRDPDTVQVKSDEKVKLKDSNSQIERRKEDFSNHNCENDILVVKKNKASGVVHIDRNIKFVDSGFSSPNYGEVKNNFYSKLKSQKYQRKAICEAQYEGDSSRNRTRKKKIETDLCENKGQSGVQLVHDDKDHFQQKPHCSYRFCDSADYKVVGVL